MLRNFYITDKYKDIKIEKDIDALAMGTSSGVIDSQYTKTD